MIWEYPVILTITLAIFLLLSGLKDRRQPFHCLCHQFHFLYKGLPCLSCMMKLDTQEIAYVSRHKWGRVRRARTEEKKWRIGTGQLSPQSPFFLPRSRSPFITRSRETEEKKWRIGTGQLSPQSPFFLPRSRSPFITRSREMYLCKTVQSC